MSTNNQSSANAARKKKTSDRGHTSAPKSREPSSTVNRIRYPTNYRYKKSRKRNLVRNLAYLQVVKKKKKIGARAFKKQPDKNLPNFSQ